MTSRTVYVVMGTTGEYSDRSEWPVRAFLSEPEAQALVTAAEQRAREIQATTPRYSSPRVTNEHDPNFSMDYTGTDYYVLTVPLVGADETIAAVVAEEEVRSANIKRGIALAGLGTPDPH